MVKSLSEFWSRFAFRSRKGAPAREFAVTPLRRRPPALRFSLEARYFAVGVLCLTFYFIAGNIGSGWIYLISASLMTALALGTLLPLIQVLGVTAWQEAPRRSLAGQQETVRLKLSRNISFPMLMPIQFLRLDYRFDLGGKSEGQTALPQLFLESVEKEHLSAWVTPPLSRGVHRLGDIVLSSCFPLGFAWWHRRFTAAKSGLITVYPKTLPVSGSFLYRLQTSVNGSGGLTRGRRSMQPTNYTQGLREYVRGDSPRLVHWASTARLGRLIVREFESEGLPCFDLLLELAAAWHDRQQFELAVTTASSLLKLGHRLGMAPQLLLSPQLSRLHLDLPAAPPGIESQMEILARVQPIVPWPYVPGEGEQPTTPVGHGRCLIIIRPEGESPTVFASAYLIEIAQQADLKVQVTSQRSFQSAAAPARGLRNPGILKSVISSEEEISQL